MKQLFVLGLIFALSPSAFAGLREDALIKLQRQAAVEKFITDANNANSELGKALRTNESLQFPVSESDLEAQVLNSAIVDNSIQKSENVGGVCEALGGATTVQITLKSAAELYEANTNLKFRAQILGSIDDGATCPELAADGALGNVKYSTEVDTFTRK